MREHHAFRRSRGPRRVDQNRNLLRAIGLDGLRDGVSIERRNADAVKRADVLDAGSGARSMSRCLLRSVGGEEDAARAAVISDLVELTR